jgi:hypothetical protein
MVVRLGEKMPSWGLSRWGGGSGLRFVPPDDEGFTLRGDKRRLVYKGRRRSHRFTILDDTAFEYDCILEREPESNVISLRMEGAEHFDFFRQPDFVTDPFLKGSYAVYKKEMLVGEGTGKLCHIHRPEIIDANGRRCWGDLSVVGNELRITIPEMWLSEAAYPVIVDPTVGTTTVGSQTHWNNVENESYDQLFIDTALAVNRFLLSETFNGAATAYVYAYDSDYYGRCKPVLYSDNSNVPLTRRSANEGTFDIAVGGGKPAGWRSTSFQTNTNIASGNYIWFGLFCDWFAPRFDFAVKCYWDFWDHLGTEIPNTYPVWSASWFYDFKLSMYFTYTSAQNYVRTITQGVSLTDSRILTGEYKRSVTQTAGANSLLGRIKTLYQTIRDLVIGGDSCFYPIWFFRSLNETLHTTDITNHLGAYYRGLFDNAEAGGEVKGGFAFFAKIVDSVYSAGAVFRGLILLVRIVAGVFIRDYLLGRFLKARSELEIKSAITREIIIESRIY